METVVFYSASGGSSGEAVGGGSNMHYFSLVSSN